VEWVVLTNGLNWQLYHIRKAMPIAEEQVFSCTLDDPARAETVNMLFVLTKEAMQRDLAEEYWSQRLAVSAPNLLRVLYSEPVVEKMRKELRALTGYRASTDELRRSLEAEVVRADFAGQAKRIGRRSGQRKERAPEAEGNIPPGPEQPLRIPTESPGGPEDPAAVSARTVASEPPSSHPTERPLE